MTTFPTGILELDKLLNLDKPFKGESTILIRGGPGSGKTTLALQILANQLAETDSEGNRLKKGLFVSLERPSEETVKYASANFGMTIYEPDQQVGKKHNFNRIDRDLFEQRVESVFYGLISKETGKTISVSAEMKEKAWAKHVKEFANDLAQSVIDNAELVIPKQSQLWVVVDSINVLERLIYSLTKAEKHRTALQGLAGALKAKLAADSVTVIFTGEHHLSGQDADGISAESFFCDVEILLSQEPLVGKTRTDPRNSSASGYNIELHHNPNKTSSAARDERQVVETRAFCRVLKSRVSKNQSRRCYYKMVKGKGLEFDESFPGDGYMLLFEDNLKQRKDWHEMLLLDAPHEFPALRYELFDRTSQQRVFSTERRFRNHSHDTDMRMVSVDTYWINWFIELDQRITIKRFLDSNRVDLNAFADGTKGISILISRIHQYFRDLKSRQAPDQSATVSITANILEVIERDLRWIYRPRDFDRIIMKCWEKFSKCTGMLHPIKFNELRLFGEDRSPIIEELKRLKYFMVNEGGTDESLLSVPFNANVSFLVYRKDLLSKLTKDDAEMLKTGLLELLKEERRNIKEFVDKHWTKFSEHFRDLWPGLDENDMPELPLESNSNEATLCEGIAKLLVLGNPPTTWEEIIVLCRYGNWEFVVETQSFDTLLCTVQEFIWACGANFDVNAEYQMRITKGHFAKLYQAIYLLQQLLRGGKNTHRIIPPNSTLNAQTFGRNYSSTKERAPRSANKWAFMRQWYSTLVDILIAVKDPATGEFHWEPDADTELEIMPLPNSFWNLYGFEPTQDCTDDPQKYYRSLPFAKRGVACWGDWHLALLSGSENEKLAVSLINNLMSAAKISNRALQGAALPAVSDFYAIYDKTPCILLPERSRNQRPDDFKLPQKNYGELRSEIFGCARSRSNTFDYRHCMREFHGLLEQLMHRPEMDPDEVGEKLIEVFKRIHALRDREMLLH